MRTIVQRFLRLVAVLSLLASSHCGLAASVAPGFSGMAAGEKLLLAPLDVELYSISAGGIVEPRADWSEAAAKHMQTAIGLQLGNLGATLQPLPEDLAAEYQEALFLHAAVARAIGTHHEGGTAYALPTKGGKLDWSFGDAFVGLGQRTGARYALFTWVRDSYASAERKATMIALALVGVGVGGGIQVGYASLVDLTTGRVVWFNRLASVRGDLRDAENAAESVTSLLEGIPVGSVK